MIYTADNVSMPCESMTSDGTAVLRVASVDTDNKIVLSHPENLSVTASGDVAVIAMKFDSVDIEFLDGGKLVSPHTLLPLPTKFTFHGLRHIEQ